jgi:hypothetical protein
MIVIASFYVLFAVMSGSVQTVVVESMVMTLFAAAAVAGFKSNTWIVVVALAAHGVFDAVHGRFVENAGVPAWWPAWCLAYDVGAAAGLAWLLRGGLGANDSGHEPSSRDAAVVVRSVRDHRPCSSTRAPFRMPGML